MGLFSRTGIVTNLDRVFTLSMTPEYWSLPHDYKTRRVRLGPSTTGAELKSRGRIRSPVLFPGGFFLFIPAKGPGATERVPKASRHILRSRVSSFGAICRSTVGSNFGRSTVSDRCKHRTFWTVRGRINGVGSSGGGPLVSEFGFDIFFDCI